MSKYFRIENAVDCVPDIKFFVTLGLSSSRGNDKLGGQFGSGMKHAIAKFVRDGVSFKICLGLDVYNVEVKNQAVKDSYGKVHYKDFIYLKKQNGGLIDLNMSSDFGAIDWQHSWMGMREIVQNAIDGTILLPNRDIDLSKRKDGDYICSYRTMNISLSDSCRAKEGFVRVYVEATPEISYYVQHIKTNVLLFSKGYDSERRVIINQPDETTKFYRKGGLVLDTKQKGLFSYNIPDLQINESRILDSWEANKQAARAITSGEPHIKTLYLKMLDNEAMNGFWEYHNVDKHRLDPDYWGEDSLTKDVETHKLDWKNAALVAYGDAVLTHDEIFNEKIVKKGYEPKKVDQYIMDMLGTTGIKTVRQILTENEIKGKEIYQPTAECRAAFDDFWEELYKLGLTDEADKPSLLMYKQSLATDPMLAYYSPTDKTVYVGIDMKTDSFSMDQMFLEECGHHITKCDDFTRGMQNWLGRAAIAYKRRNYS